MTRERLTRARVCAMTPDAIVAWIHQLQDKAENAESALERVLMRELTERRHQPASEMSIREAMAMHIASGLEASRGENEIRDPNFARYVQWVVDTLCDRLHGDA